MFQKIAALGLEEIILCHMEEVGLKAIIAIHNTRLGPALGGCRMWTYENDDAAIVDAMRLARGMTYKASISGLNLGGGKAVIIGDPKTQKTEALFRTFGRFVESLNGRYITAEDVGTTVQEMTWIHSETRHVVGIEKSAGGSGDPSPYTARGVFQGISAAAEFLYSSNDLRGKVVALQGLGNVGRNLAEQLHRAGCKLIVSDLNETACAAAVEKYKAEVCPPHQIHQVECDIFSPCAMGSVVNEKSFNDLRCKIIAGAANNQLSNDEMGLMLRDRGILYCPDYVINAGGLINVSIELEGYNEERALLLVNNIRNTVTSILHHAKEHKIATSLAADRLAEARIRSLDPVPRVWSGSNSLRELRIGK